MEKYIKEIKGLNKTYISLNEIEEIIKINDYEQFVKTIKELTDINIIKPIKTKNNTNGKMPALYLKYRIILFGEAYELQGRIQTKAENAGSGGPAQTEERAAGRTGSVRR